MDLHFCSRCGISIPQSEIDAGGALGAGGKYFCSEHRGGAAVAVAESPHAGGAEPGPGLPGEDPELLFCANCRVSIPQDDSKSGRAHREFGSLLCAGCSKADPGERAARREAVEAEMKADVDAQDPVVARRCSVCSAAVPYGQIVTGRAKVEGNRVVCERCRTAALGATAAAGTGGTSPWLVLAIVILVAGALGYFGTRAWFDAKKPAAGPDPLVLLRDLRADADRRFAEFDSRLFDAAKAAAQPDARAAAERARIDAETATIRQMLSELRADSAKSDSEFAQRIARIEGQLANLSDMMRGLAARSPEAPAPVEKPPAPPAPPPGDGTAPSKPEPAGVNPAVAKLCRDLLESPDDGARFTAATELTTLKDPAAIPSLVKALSDDKHYFVRRGCARALGALRAWLAVPVLVKSLEDREVFVALAANQALQGITGNDFGVTHDTPAGQRKTKAAAADKWWEKNKDRPPDGVSLHPITN